MATRRYNVPIYQDISTAEEITPRPQDIRDVPQNRHQRARNSRVCATNSL
jgi:hypothetical protein